MRDLRLVDELLETSGSAGRALSRDMRVGDYSIGLEQCSPSPRGPWLPAVEGDG